MKYVRKVTALVLAIIFCAAIIIGIGVIYSVKNVNVEFIDYSGEYVEEYAKAKDNLNKLKGSGIMFLSDGDVQSKIPEGGSIVLESYEKIYPCTVNVTLKERVECFVVRNGEQVAIYDEDGVLMRSVRVENGEYLNKLDGSPDVVLKTLEGGSFSQEDYKSVATLLTQVKSSFSSLRKLVESVTVYGSLNSAEIALRSGVSVVVYDWQNNAKAKVEAVYDVYKNLSDKQKTCGMITVGDVEQEGEASAKYR